MEPFKQSSSAALNPGLTWSNVASQPKCSKAVILQRCIPQNSKSCISSENKTQRQPLDMCATHAPPKYQNCHHTSVSLKAHCLPFILFRYCQMLFFGIFLFSGSGEFSNPTQIHTGWGLYKYSFSASTWQEAKRWPVWLFELWRWTQQQWKVKVNSEYTKLSYISDLSDWSLAIMGVQTSKEILSEFVVIKKNIRIWAHRWFCITVWSSIY